MTVLLQVWTRVTGNFVVTVHTTLYENLENRAAQLDGRCCDARDRHTCDQMNSDQFCDNSFIYCLRPFDTESREKGCFFGYPAVQSLTAMDGVYVNFYQDTVLGLSNPMIFRISEDWKVSIKSPLVITSLSTHCFQGIQLYIAVVDVDTDRDDDLVDEFIIDLPADTLNGSRELSYARGVHMIASISLTVSVECDMYYYGDRCQYINSCELIPSLCYNRGQCQSVQNGFRCDCVIGYNGTYCEKTSTVAEPDFQCGSSNCSGNGVCTRVVDQYYNNYCTCNPGFYGTECGGRINNDYSPNIAEAAGGVLGALIGLILVAIVIVNIILIFSKQKKKIEHRGKSW